MRTVGVPAWATAPPPGYVAPLAIPLDAHQRAVVDWTPPAAGPPAVVAAAAGSGKSTVLLARTLRLLSEGRCPPEAICLLAFNRDAASALRARLRALAGEVGARVQAFTFHAWCYALLRCWFPADARLGAGRILGVSSGIPHPAALIGALLREHKIDLEWRPARDAFSRLSEELVDLDAPGAEAAVAAALPDHAVRPDKLLALALAWRDLKRKDHLIEFDDMLGEVALWIQRAPEAPHVAALARMYAHVMADEHQDVSLARTVIAEWLAQGAQSAVLVGDQRQSINAFAGAKPALFARLAEQAKAAGRFFTLPVNRRSAARVVDLANTVAEGHAWNLGGACSPRDDAPQGEPIRLVEVPTPREEAAHVAEDILRRVAAGMPYSVAGRPSFGVLSRTNAGLVPLETALAARDLPIRVMGGGAGVWATSVGEEVLAYLRCAEAAGGHAASAIGAVAGAAAPDWNLTRVANMPKRYARRQDVIAALVRTKERGEGIVPALRAVADGVAQQERGKRAVADGIRRLADDLVALARMPWPRRCAQVATWLAEGGGKLAGDDDREALARALCDVAGELGSVAAIEAHQRKVAREVGDQAIVLGTIHAWKGAEAEVVYATGVRSGHLPHKRTDDEDEERRLLYVAVTRARLACVLSTGGPRSRFLAEVGL